MAYYNADYDFFLPIPGRQVRSTLRQTQQPLWLIKQTTTAPQTTSVRPSLQLQQHLATMVVSVVRRMVASSEQQVAEQHWDQQPTANNQGQVLVSNEKKEARWTVLSRTQDGVFQCPCVVSRACTLEAVSQIYLLSAPASIKFNILLNWFKKFPLANSASKSRMTAFNQPDSSPLFRPPPFGVMLKLQRLPPHVSLQ
jgi:hypothetical protein